MSPGAQGGSHDVPALLSGSTVVVALAVAEVPSVPDPVDAEVIAVSLEAVGSLVPSEDAVDVALPMGSSLKQATVANTTMHELLCMPTQS